MSEVDIAERLFDYRMSRGWSQVETAERAGISPTTVSHVETGQVLPYTVTLRKLARAFGVSLEEFLSEKPPKAAGPSLPERILRDGPGHAYLLSTLRGTIEEAEGMSVPEILVRLQDLSAEARHLRGLRYEDYPAMVRETPETLHEAKREVGAVRRGLLSRALALSEVAESKRAPANEADFAALLLELERAREEANVPN